MHVVDIERVELVYFQLKGIARTWHDQRKEVRHEDALLASWTFLEKAFLGCFFPQELIETNIREFLTIKQNSLSVYEWIEVNPNV